VVSAAPQSPQNFSPASYRVPQAAQVSASGAPHAVQNFRLSRFSCAQMGQRMPVPFDQKRAEQKIQAVTIL
jgi:hypothetical protein